MTTRIECPACGVSEARDKFEVRGYGIAQCCSCGTLFVRECPLEGEIERLYETGSYYDLPRASVERIVRENRRRLAILAKWKRTGRFLDVGCAKGQLLDEARRLGYETFGIEPNRINASSACKGGHKVICSGLEETEHVYGNDRFDVITCLDVIEHVREPWGVMQRLTRWLDPEGLLVVSTPNYSGLVAKVLGAKDPYMTPPEHLTFFTKKGLRALAYRCNLAVRATASYGVLTDAEMNRAISRYLPWLPSRIAPFVCGLVRTGFSGANVIGVGLEQELYLYRRG